MFRSICASALYAFTVALTLANSACAEAITPATSEFIRGPMLLSATLPDGAAIAFDALTIRPNSPGRFPLAILVRGSSTEPGEIAMPKGRVEPAEFTGPALAFARHGYATVSIQRRGGTLDPTTRQSAGIADGANANCDTMDYAAEARASALDIAAATAALRQEPWVDSTRVLLVGYSAGSMAVVAAGALNPPGVVGVVNFMGGPRGYRPEQFCGDNKLADAFSAFGKTAKTPGLWLYAPNERTLNPKTAQTLFDAYAGAGAQGQMKVLSPSGANDQNSLFHVPADVWWPDVAAYLDAMHLPTMIAAQAQAPAALPMPKLNEACRELFRNFLDSRTEAKAFAITPEGQCGSSIMASTLAQAKDEAMRFCRDQWTGCRLYAIGDQLVEKER